jgi:hypothetical protein
MFRFVILSTIIIIATVLYAPGSANAARYCAQIRGSAALDCHYATMHQCIQSVKAKGGGRCHKRK